MKAVFVVCVTVSLFVIGLIRAIQMLRAVLSFINRRCLRTKLNLKKRYHKSGDEWALVTGASDGIGAEYCK
jgi:hypothetical protein